MGEMSTTPMDSRGKLRGKCTECGDCSSYQRPPTGSKCLKCDCVPGKHEIKLPFGDDVHDAMPLISPAVDEESHFVSPKCWCGTEAYFDINTRTEYHCCQLHQDSDFESPQANSIAMALPISVAQANYSQINTSQAAIAFKDPSLCAIEDCYNPRYKDASGQVMECCGFTHAMQLMVLKQKTAQGMHQKVVKGITHCLLPNCNRVTYPFMNYCGRTHADQGMKMGLQSPQVSSAEKDGSVCMLPGCRQPKCIDSESGSFFDFCGKSHAAEAKKKGIKIVPGDSSGPKLDSMCMLDGCRRPKRKKSDQLSCYDYCCQEHASAAANSASSVTKDDNMCIIPNCTRPKYVNPVCKTTSDYCGKKHRDEGVQRGIFPILKNRSEVDKFLKSFSSILTVVHIQENVHAKPDGALYKKFIAARDSLPADCRKTCLAFHGTPEQNIDSICRNGFDVSKRNTNGQLYGTGEYFATSPSTPKGYTGGGKKMLLTELLLGQSGTHHTQHGEIIVMKYPAHDLPRFIITFQ